MINIFKELEEHGWIQFKNQTDTFHEFFEAYPKFRDEYFPLFRLKEATPDFFITFPDRWVIISPEEKGIFKEACQEFYSFDLHGNDQNSGRLAIFNNDGDEIVEYSERFKFACYIANIIGGDRASHNNSDYTEL